MRCGCLEDKKGSKVVKTICPTWNLRAFYLPAYKVHFYLLIPYPPFPPGLLSSIDLGLMQEIGRPGLEGGERSSDTLGGREVLDPHIFSLSRPHVDLPSIANHVDKSFGWEGRGIRRQW